MNKNNYTINKLVSLFANLTNQELRQLARFFSGDDVALRFSSLIKEIIWLREQESKKEESNEIKIQQYHPMSPRVSSIRRIKQSGDASSNKMKVRFFKLLNNREFFHNTKDVVDAANKIFRLRLSYETYRKRGRRDIIKKCWKLFEQMPRKKKHMILNAFRNRIVHLGDSEGYYELFKILSQNE